MKIKINGELKLEQLEEIMDFIDYYNSTDGSADFIKNAKAKNGKTTINVDGNTVKFQLSVIGSVYNSESCDIDKLEFIIKG